MVIRNKSLIDECSLIDIYADDNHKGEQHLLLEGSRRSTTDEEASCIDERIVSDCPQIEVQADVTGTFLITSNRKNKKILFLVNNNQSGIRAKIKSDQIIREDSSR